MKTKKQNIVITLKRYEGWDFSENKIEYYEPHNGVSEKLFFHLVAHNDEDIKIDLGGYIHNESLTEFKFLAKAHGWKVKIV
jgi:hypothetical protein